MLTVLCVLHYSVSYVKQELLCLKYNEMFANVFVVEHRVRSLFHLGDTR